MRDRGRDKDATTPPRMPDTTPPAYPSGDFSYTLEVVMEMQKAVGKLTEAVDTLKQQSGNHDSKLDGIGKDVHAAKVGLKIIMGVFVVSGTILGFLLNRIAEVLQAYLTATAIKPH